MPNLSVYKVKPQSGKGKLKTLHRDSHLPIRDFVQIPVPENTEVVQTRPSAKERAQKRCERARTEHSNPMECETSTESSDIEFDWPHRPYRIYLENIMQRRDEIDTDRPDKSRSLHLIE